MGDCTATIHIRYWRDPLILGLHVLRLRSSKLRRGHMVRVLSCIDYLDLGVASVYLATLKSLSPKPGSQDRRRQKEGKSRKRFDMAFDALVCLSVPEGAY